ncbi:MAG: phospholipid/cholesterol/gamma-HCH transport system permease protein, partial [Solirubrobacteraceae bacterium]|nr:phospholipid/cholesterol/gamma-HCH transport system permease protein [Solirubrobacteraceae bacterium]
MGGWFAIPRDWLSSFGEIARFCGRIMGQVYG